MADWAYDAIFYHIYPLGLCGAPDKNDFVSAPPYHQPSTTTLLVEHYGTILVYMSKPSFQSKVLYIILRLIGWKRYLNRIKERMESGGKALHAEPSRKLYEKHHITIQEVKGHTVWTITPKENVGAKHIYYLHGGAYVNGFAKQHWQFISNLVDTLKCTVTAPYYPLAPKYHVDNAFAMVFPIYQELLGKAGAANLTVMGDSAGGGMSLALAQRLRNEGIEQPSNLILLSPWLDVTMTNPDIQELDKLDPFLSVQGLKDAGKMYAGEMELTNYLVSPIYGSLEGLAPITLYVGTHDVFAADCRKFKAKAAAEGVTIDYHEYEEMVHVWMLLPLPEAKKVAKEIVDKLKRH
ncbi:MAG: alpha/beta hydrolase fold domain-containing protein [Acidobacteriota bacterium]